MQSVHGSDFSKACRDCGVTVYFSDSVRANNGSRIPLEKDGRRHTCTVAEEGIILQAGLYIERVNRRLSTWRLKLIKEVKS